MVHSGGGGRRITEFKAGRGYRVSSRRAKGTHRSYVWGKKEGRNRGRKEERQAGHPLALAWHGFGSQGQQGSREFKLLI